MRLNSVVLTLVVFFLAALAQPGASLGDPKAFSLSLAYVLGVTIIYALACLLLKICKFRLPSGEGVPFLAMFNIGLSCFMLHSVIGMFLQVGK